MKKLYLYIRLSDADDDLKCKTESESMGNKNLFEIVTKLMPDYKPGSGIRYKVTGVLDMENKIMYYDMTTAETTEFRAPKN